MRHVSIETRGRIMTGTRFVAIDWSGAAKGARRKIWLAEVRAGNPVRLEGGRNRAEIARHLVDEASRDPDVVIGLDFAFSFPAWFLHEMGLGSARSLEASSRARGSLAPRLRSTVLGATRATAAHASCPLPAHGGESAAYRGEPAKERLPNRWSGGGRNRLGSWNADSR